MKENAMIPFSTFDRMHMKIRKELDKAYESVVNGGWFIHGKECGNFEEAYSSYLGIDYCIGVGNGLDAIYLSLKAAGIKAGDEVIIPSHTFIATALAVASFSFITIQFCN